MSRRISQPRSLARGTAMTSPSLTRALPLGALRFPWQHDREDARCYIRPRSSRFLVSNLSGVIRPESRSSPSLWICSGMSAVEGAVAGSNCPVLAVDHSQRALGTEGEGVGRKAKHSANAWGTDGPRLRCRRPPIAAQGSRIACEEFVCRVCIARVVGTDQRVPGLTDCCNARIANRSSWKSGECRPGRRSKSLFILALDAGNEGPRQLDKDVDASNEGEPQKEHRQRDGDPRRSPLTTERVADDDERR